jgi:hypothetical protein
LGVAFWELGINLSKPRLAALRDSSETRIGTARMAITVVARVRELYPPSSMMRVKIEENRRIFLTAMAQIKQRMILGADKNVYVEPTIWTIEWARDFYKYPVSQSN